MSSNPIQAIPIFASRWERPPYSLYHGRYRGFAATTHAHPEAQLLVPLGGRMHLVAGEQAQILGPESAAWLPPGLRHRFVHLDGQLDFLALEVDGWPPLLPAALAEAPADRPLVAQAPGLRWLGQVLARELDEPGPGTERVVLCCLEPLFVYLERSLLRGAPAPGATSPEVRLVIEAILAGYMDALEVPALAALAGLSPRQLERRFRDEVATTPKRFLTEVRIGAAEALLRETDEAIAQIALAVGFKNPSHFAATFRSLKGKLPHAAREPVGRTR